MKANKNALPAGDALIGEIHVDGICDPALQVWIRPGQRIELLFGCYEWSLNEREAQALTSLLAAAIWRVRP